MSDTALEAEWLVRLSALRADALDCLQTSFALLADRAYGDTAHLALGSRWSFPFELPTWGADRDQRALQARIDQAADLIHLRVEGRWTGLTGGQVHKLAQDYLYVVADAFDMEWCPYFRKSHMQHSFLVLAVPGDEAALVIDGYSNDTEWGTARPVVKSMSVEALNTVCGTGADALAIRHGRLPVIDVNRAVETIAVRQLKDRSVVERYVAAARAQARDPAAFQNLVLDIWTFGRERLLYELWLEKVQPPYANCTQVVRWQQLAARSYVGLRRAERGRGVDHSLVDALVDECAALLLTPECSDTSRAANQLTHEDSSIVQLTLQTALRTILGAQEPLERSATLRSIPGFDSFKLIDIIDAVEEQLGVAVPPERFAQANFQTVQSLENLFSDLKGPDHAARA